MKKRIKSLRKTIAAHPLLSLFFIFAVVLIVASHLFYLDTSPPALAHDEIEYQLSGKTFARYGTDLSGYRFPHNLISTETEGNVSTFPVMVFALFQGISNNQNILTARLPNFLIIVAIAIALSFFTQTIFRNKSLSTLVGILFLISPWAFFLSRYATESPLSLLFLLTAMTLLLTVSGKKLFIALLFFALSFYSYHAAKLIIPLIAGCLLVYRVKVKNTGLPKLSLKHGVLFFMGICLLFFSYVIISKMLPYSNLDKRGGDIVLFDSKSTSSLVDIQRKISLENPYNSLFVNKYTLGGRDLLVRYISAFSPRVLFFEGDLRVVYAYFYHGLFFYVDALFLLLGVFFLIKKRPKALGLLFALILISPLPSALNQYGTSYVHRSFFLLPLLLIVIAFGIYESYVFLKKYIPGVIIIVAISGLFFLSYANFLHFYFYRYPVSSGEYYALDNRMVANFIRVNDPARPIEVYTENPRDAYTATLYYLNDPELLRHHIEHVDEFNHTDVYKMRNISFTYGCPRQFKDQTTYVIAYEKACVNDKPPAFTLNNPLDEGPMFLIYNSDTCRNQTFGKWRRFKKVADYKMEQMNKKEFCTTWVGSY